MTTEFMADTKPGDAVASAPPTRWGTIIVLTLLMAGCIGLWALAQILGMQFALPPH
jgi:hypothetical protein